MAFQDKTLTCSDCGATFTFSAEDQEFFQSKGYTNEPKRCPECRQARKTERFGSSGGGARRQMFPATCAHVVRCSPLPVPSAARQPKYPSNPAVINRSTVPIVTGRPDPADN